MPKYYLLDENKNLVEGYDKEGFLALLEQAIEDGDLENIDADSAFVSKFKSLLNGTTHHLEFVTQAQYNQLVEDEEVQPNTYYFITDDQSVEDLEEQIEEYEQHVSNLENGLQDGSIVAKNAENATNATNAENATNATNAENATNATKTSFSNATTRMIALSTFFDEWQLEDNYGYYHLYYVTSSTYGSEMINLGVVYLNFNGTIDTINVSAIQPYWVGSATKPSFRHFVFIFVIKGLNKVLPMIFFQEPSSSTYSDDLVGTSNGGYFYYKRIK